MMIVGAIVLAAGKSERMGKNKLLLRFDGKLLIENILDALTIAGINDQEQISFLDIFSDDMFAFLDLCY
jgi:molybdopterin-guanine dinucleotide biosynthesis protein A